MCHVLCNATVKRRTTYLAAKFRADRAANLQVSRIILVRRIVPWAISRLSVLPEAFGTMCSLCNLKFNVLARADLLPQI